MRKKALLIVLSLVACGAITLVIAYSSATVVNPAAIKIISSNEAILALEPGDPRLYANYCYIDHDGALYLNFAAPGFPPDSIFEWDELFRITNNSAESIRVSIESDGERIPYISLKPYGGNSHFIEDGLNRSYTHPLAPGESVSLSVSFHIPENPDKGHQTGVLRVTAEAAVP